MRLSELALVRVLGHHDAYHVARKAGLHELLHRGVCRVTVGEERRGVHAA